MRHGMNEKWAAMFEFIQLLTQTVELHSPPEARRYNCGMGEFLARTLLGDFAECPLGDLSLWAKQSALYLNAHEEERLRKQGLDPWTGQPDPYAGTYGGS